MKEGLAAVEFPFHTFALCVFLYWLSISCGSFLEVFPACVSIRGGAFWSTLAPSTECRVQPHPQKSQTLKQQGAPPLTNTSGRLKGLSTQATLGVTVDTVQRARWMHEKRGRDWTRELPMMSPDGSKREQIRRVKAKRKCSERTNAGWVSS